MSDLEAIKEKLRTDLAWRSPSGKPQGIVALSREQAQVILEALEKKQNNNG